MIRAKRSVLLFIISVFILFFLSAHPLPAAPLNLHYQLSPLSATNHRISVPKEAALMAAQITRGDGNLDLFLKKGAPLTGSSLSQIREDSDIYVDTDGWQEILAINPSSSPKISKGEWYLAVVNLNEHPTLYTVSVFLEPQTEAMTNLYFPYVIEYNNWDTKICLLNWSSTETISGELTAYDRSGTKLTGSQHLSIAPNVRLELQDSETFPQPENIYYMIFSSATKTAKGYADVFIKGVYRTALPAISIITAGDLYIPHIASDSNWETELSFLNTTPESKDLTLEFNTGQALKLTLGPGVYDSFTIKSLFDHASQPDITSAVIRNAAGILGVELFSNSSERILEGLLPKSDATHIRFTSDRQLSTEYFH